MVCFAASTSPTPAHSPFNHSPLPSTASPDNQQPFVYKRTLGPITEDDAHAYYGRIEDMADPLEMVGYCRIL